MFVTLARTLNMSEAARELGQTPSAISHALKALETNLGCRIFERSPRHMNLLPTGHTLLPEAIAVLDHLRLLRANVDALTGKQESRVRLSANTDILNFLLPAVLKKFRGLYPDCPVQIEGLPTTKGSSPLTDGQVDLAVLLEPASNPQLDMTLLGADELRLIVNSRHEWASKSRVPLGEILARKPLVTDCGESHKWITDYFKNETRGTPSRFEFENEQAIKVRLTDNTGIALLPSWAVAAHLKAGSLTQISLGRVPLKRRWMLACRKAYTLNPAETLFVNLTKAAIQKWGN
ncbi:MAG: LysR family transcriptional regulator [Opitutus sp.]|nr:LysR family transcriptional regulator [Opitutus sp.]